MFLEARAELAKKALTRVDATTGTSSRKCKNRRSEAPVSRQR